jgi:hypothetical protein
VLLEALLGGARARADVEPGESGVAAPAGGAGEFDDVYASGHAFSFDADEALPSSGHIATSYLVYSVGDERNVMQHTPTSELVDEISKWTAGLGILTTALAPLALPFLILLTVALLPLLIPLIAIGLVAAILAAPVVLIRAVVRWSRKAERGRRVRAAPSRNPAP